MKSINTLMMIAAMMFCCVNSANAQKYDYDNKHEVAVSFGYFSTSDWLNIFEDIGISMSGLKIENSSFKGPVSAEYFYHPNKWLGVGGILSYGSMKQDVLIGNSKIGDDKNSYISVIPAAKFDWLRKKNFGLYSKVGIGATLRHEKVEYTDGKDNYDNTTVHVNWQISVLGVEVGSQKLRGFLELGAGEQGSTLIGLRYKF